MQPIGDDQSYFQPLKPGLFSNLAISSRVPPKWYALHTRPRAERVVRAHLLWYRIESFYPLQRKRRSRIEERKEATSPLFPGYIFCRTALDIPLRIVSIPGVLRFVGCEGRPTPVLDAEIAAIQRLEQSCRALRSMPFFEQGQRVRVCGGALEGLEGRVLRVKNKDMLVVSVELLRRSVCVSLESDCVEHI